MADVEAGMLDPASENNKDDPAASRRRLDGLVAGTTNASRVHAVGGPVDAWPSGFVVATADAWRAAGWSEPVLAVVLDPEPDHRPDVLDALRDNAAWVVCRTEDVEALRGAAPDLAERVIAVPSSGAVDPVADLRLTFEARGDNEIPALLLPLAATLSEHVLVHGVRLPPADPDAFASHVFRLVRALEERVIVVASATDTDVPALRSRQIPPVTTRVPTPVDFVVMAPDWESDFGHYGMYALATMAAARSSGLSTVTLASRCLDEAEDVIPYFHQSTYLLRSFAAQAETWRSEFRQVLAEYVTPGGVAFMDCAGFQHVEAAASVSEEFPDRHLVLNLMRAHVDIADARLPGIESRAVRELLRGILTRAEQAGVSVMVDTEALQSDVRDALGHELAVLPMSTATQVPATARPVGPSTDRPLVLFPAKVRGRSALGSTERMATMLAAQPNGPRVAVRPDRPPGGSSPQDDLMFERLAAAGVELLGSRLPPGEYESLLHEAAVVVLVYDPQEFRTRTSGLTVDALLAGTPVVTTQHSWSASVVERTGGGATAPFGDDEAFCAQVMAVLDDLDARRAPLVVGHAELVEEFSLARRVDVVRAAGRTAAARAGADTSDHAHPDLGVVLTGLPGPTAVAAGVGEAGRALKAAQRSSARLVEQTDVIRTLRRELHHERGRSHALSVRLEESEGKEQKAQEVLTSTREKLAAANQEIARRRRPWYRKVWSRLRRWGARR